MRYPVGVRFRELPALPTDLEAATPAEIDTVLAVLDEEHGKAMQRAAEYEALADEYADSSWRGGDYEATAEEYRQRAEETAKLIKPLNDEFRRRGGWERVFKVLNHDGHFHKERSCTTTYATTLWGWTPQLSGLTVDEIISEVGCFACTVCYPGAPRHPKFIEMERQRAEEEAKKASTICEGSGQYYDGEKVAHGYGHGYGRCPVCGDTESLTATYKFRKHPSRAAKEAKKLAEALKKLPREQALAIKVDAALDKHGRGANFYSLWTSGKLPDSVYYVIADLQKKWREVNE